jgi:ribosomal protein S18 acetylase RimI-like enzyme
MEPITADSAPTMIVRNATENDVAAIAALHAESWRSNYRNVLSDGYLEKDVYRERLVVWQERFSKPSQKPMFVLVAEAESVLTGFVCVFPNEDAIFGSFLDNLHVVPSMTSHGIGRRLLLDAAKRLVMDGSRVGLYLWVIEQNQRALRFYERAGARVVGSRLNTMPDNRQLLALRCYWASPKILVL